MAVVSQNQKIELIPAGPKEPVYTITDLSEIADFLKEERISEWNYITSVPEDAAKICDVVRYAHRRHTIVKELEEQYRMLFMRTTTNIMSNEEK